MPGSPFFAWLSGSQKLPSALQPGHVGQIADHNPYADLQLNLGRFQNGIRSTKALYLGAGDVAGLLLASKGDSGK
jgi:hypothetical protein